MDHGVTFFWWLIRTEMWFRIWWIAQGSHWKFARHAWSVRVYILGLFSPFWSSLWYLHLHRVRRASVRSSIFLIIHEHRFPPPSEPVHHGVSTLILAYFWFTKQAESVLVFVFLVFGLSLHSCDTRLWAHGTYLFSGSVFVNNPTPFTFLLSLFSLSPFGVRWCIVQAVRYFGCSRFLLSNGVVKVEIYIVIYCITCRELKQIIHFHTSTLIWCAWW